MKKIVLAVIALSGALGVHAQADTTAAEKVDTIKVGGMIIIKKGDKDSDKDDKTINISSRRKRKSSAVSTNWGVVDLGFANFHDQTNYSSAETQAFAPGINEDHMTLRTAKSVNVNIWAFMQQVNLVKHVVNFKWGLGLELNNYRFDNEQVRFQKNPTLVTLDPSLKDSAKKNKLAVDYISMPAMINFNFTPRREKSFGLSAGIQAGYLYSARQKFKMENDDKTKLHDDFDLRKWKISYIGELSLGIVTLYGSYATQSMWEKGFDHTPYTVGIRLKH
ncbi:MAG TPA: outer membrane beta-barrel protein [Flavisolibacter sp.]